MYKKIIRLVESKHVHPYLFAVYPILFLYSRNISFFDFYALLLPILIVLILAYVLIRLLSYPVKNKNKLSLTSSFLLLAFLSYGHFERLFNSTGPITGLYALIVWVAMLMCGILMIFYLVKERYRVGYYMNIFSSILVIIAVGQIIFFRLENTKPDLRLVEGDSSGGVLGTSSSAEDNNPNFYYIILDGYARNDVLKDYYDYDNSSFIKELEKRGFYVAGKSSSNYDATALSLPSSLSMNYLQNVFVSLDEKLMDRTPLHDLFKDNQVMKLLKEKDYEIKIISSGYYGAESKDINDFFSNGFSLGEFESAVLDLTPIPRILQTASFSKYDKIVSIHRKTIQGAFERLGDSSQLKGNNFIFAHIMLPHPPFVYGANGEPVEFYESLGNWDGSHLVIEGVMSKDEYVSYYRNQLIYVSKVILKIIDRIIAESESPPVIILQSDHGPGSMLNWEDYMKSNLRERFGILNAYLIPSRNYEDFNQNITPVNSFRLVFNDVFGLEYPYLEDRNYFSTFSQPFKFIDITQKLHEENN